MSRTEARMPSWIERLIHVTQRAVARARGQEGNPEGWAGYLLQESLLEAEAEMGHCNVLVIGKSGVGKSTLVNAVFKDELARTGVGSPVTRHIRKYSKQGCPITIYDTPGMELAGEQNTQIRLEVAQLIDELRFKDPKHHIHIVWYCIHHELKRLEETEREWLRELELKDVPVILVLTQCLEYPNPEESEFFQYLQRQNLPVRYIVPVLARDKVINRHLTIPAHGLEHLIGCTSELLPEAARLAFIRQQLLRVDLKADAAFKYVSAYVASAAFIGAAPLPFADAPLLVASQVGMIANISFIFGYKASPSFYYSLIASLAGIGGAVVTGRAIVSNLLKMIPGAGSLAGGIIQSTTAATLTLSLGLAYIELMKAIARAEIRGIQLSQKEVQEIFVREYRQYAASRRTALKE
ncbi:YcjF family protein [Synechococcus sp. O70.2]|uniref:YcjF family protein n=1 Tax=unclassified Synechococcus TaxID=2626047 RepID=UPI0039C310D2